MGESSGDPIASQKAKYKGRMKKICCCGVVWFFLGVTFFVVAIALLVSFAKYWDDNQDWRRGLAYTGVAFILIGLLMATIGIVFCIVLYMFYKRLSGDHALTTHFKPPVYEYGKAPYPQQPMGQGGYSQVSTGTGMTTTGPSSNVAPSAPPAGEPGSKPADVNIEIKEHTKF